MGIDIRAETLIPIGDVPHYLPRSKAGRKVSLATVHRWRQRGVQGRRLEAIKVGGRWYTSAEALQRYIDRLSHESDGGRRDADRQLGAHEQASAEAQRILWGRSHTRKN